MVQAIKLVHFLFRRKIAAARGVHSSAYCGSLFVGQSEYAAATRFDFASDVGEFFLILFRPGLNLL
jgi:hypothetical protein